MSGYVNDFGDSRSQLVGCFEGTLRSAQHVLAW